MKKTSAAVSSTALALTTLTALAVPASAVSAPFAVSAKYCSNIDSAQVSIVLHSPYSADAINNPGFYQTSIKLFDGNTDTGQVFNDYVNSSIEGSTTGFSLTGVSDPNIKISIDGNDLPDTYEFADLYVPFAGGSGTQADPFQISTAAQLQAITCHVYPTEYDPVTLDENVQRFKLMNDIDLSAYSDAYEWTPIGFRNGGTDTRFRGRLLGNGKTLSNLTVNSRGLQHVGLFSEIYSGEVENINIRNFDVTGHDRVGILTGKTYGSGIDEITIKNSKVTGANIVGGVVGEADRGHVTNYNVDVVVNVIPIPNNTSQRMGAIVGESEYQSIRKGVSKVQFQTDPDAAGLLDANSNPIQTEAQISKIGGVIGLLDDGSDIRDVRTESEFDFSGYARLQYFGGFVGETEMGAILDSTSKIQLDVDDIARIDGVTGLIGYPVKVSLSGINASGELNINTESAGYLGANFGNFYEAATVMDIYSDIDMNVTTSGPGEISAIAGVIQKSRIQHSVFAGDTNIVITGCNGSGNIGIFAGRQQSHGGFNKVIVSGAFNVDNQAECDYTVSTSISSIQPNDPPIFRDSYWASEKIDETLVSGFGFGEGVTNKQLASEKFWASQGFDMVNDFAINSKGQLVPRAAIAAVDESQAGPAGRIAFGKLLKSGKRSYNVNLENKFAGKNATVRVVRNGAKKVIKKAVLSALGNAMFKSKFALQSGDKLQVVISGKRIVNYTVR